MAAIKSIRGLQNLANLEQFTADWNHLAAVDFSGLANLTSIDVSDCDIVGGGGNSLTSVNVTGCISLTQLRIDDSDFSGGFPDLSTCTSLEFFDADQCNIQGTLDLSNVPALKGFDVFGNSGLTNLVLSSTQPLGDGYSLGCNGTALTQASVDAILHACASGSAIEGTFSCEDGTQGYPSEYGVEAIRVLDGRGWNIAVQQYSNTLILTSPQATSGDTCVALGNNNVNDPGGYIHKDATLEVGSYLYDNASLLTPLADGWYGQNADGGIAYQVSGSNGLIVAQFICD